MSWTSSSAAVPGTPSDRATASAPTSVSQQPRAPQRQRRPPDSRSCGRALRRSRRLRAWAGRRGSTRRRRPPCPERRRRRRRRERRRGHARRERRGRHRCRRDPQSGQALGRAVPRAARPATRGWERTARCRPATHQTGYGNPEADHVSSREMTRRAAPGRWRRAGRPRPPASDRRSRQNGAPGRDRQARRGQPTPAGPRRRRQAPAPTPCRRAPSERAALPTAAGGPRDALRGPGPVSRARPPTPRSCCDSGPAGR